MINYDEIIRQRILNKIHLCRNDNGIIKWKCFVLLEGKSSIHLLVMDRTILKAPDSFLM